MSTAAMNYLKWLNYWGPDEISPHQPVVYALNVVRVHAGKVSHTITVLKLDHAYHTPGKKMFFSTVETPSIGIGNTIGIYFVFKKR